MKKIIYFSLLLITLFTIAACFSETETPGAAAKKYAEYLVSGDYEKFVDAIAIESDEDQAPEQIKETKDGILSLLKEKGAKAIEERGGIESTEVVSETISEDGKTAKVVIKQTYGNGEVEENDYNMVKEENTWKMSEVK
ncbi:hypothetical protein EZS27_015131 [termite gut metagenome]|uniref:DUF4878 domain-containing protein n=1 Tax=termite gut metagenome TaxID=433724 RepID=A0A5J4RRV0_9ZZZZ